MASEGKIRILKISNLPGSFMAQQRSDAKTVEAVGRASLLNRGKHKGQLVDWEKTEMPISLRRSMNPAEG
jgi:hypothetical protein